MCNGRRHHSDLENALLLATVVILLLAGGAERLGAEAPMIAVKIAMPQTIWHPGDKVRLHIEEDNLSDQSILLSENRTGDMRSGIVVKDSDGKLAPLLADMSKNLRIGRRYSQALEPQQHFAQDVNLARQYNLTKAGSYTVFVVKQDPLTHQKVQSNTLDFRVE